MITANNLSYSYPDKKLYENISFKLKKGDHCALMGVSASGKSTLVDLIIKPNKYMYQGDLDIDPNLTFGHVSQLAPSNKIKAMTVFDYIARDFNKLQDKLDLISRKMETSSELDSLLESYQNTLDEFDLIGGHDFENNINKQLNLADLMTHKNLLISDLSGGEFKLVQVIKEMLNSPDLLIMDEPDVFLDFENLNSLRDLINNHTGMLLVITHNRYLLNHCFNKILHLENMALQEFEGSFIEYNLERLENKITLQELALADIEEIKRNEALIERLGYRAMATDNASSGKSLKARVKIQERLKERKVKMPFTYLPQPKISLTTSNPIEDDLAIKLSDYSLSFDELLLENVNFEIKPKDKLAIIGPNGTGKTSLLREIFENNNKAIEVNENIKMAYLAQVHSEILNESNTIMDEFLKAGLKTYQEVISHLADYGFKESSLKREISSLSGGEKNLLQLAKVSTSNANMLLLDEPTSHLDTFTQLALEKALEDYNGGIIMVSHDFYSVINSMDYVLIIDDKTIRKSQIRNFKRMIYKRYFDRKYLEFEEKRKELETKIELALKDNDFEEAKVLFETLEKLL